MSRPPLLLVDIDGVISLFGFDRRTPPAGTFVSVDGMPHFLSALAAEQLLLLGEDFELVWCSGWEEKADEHLPSALGLPAGLPHISFEPTNGEGGSGGSLHASREDGRHWKLPAIDRFAGDQHPLAWVDDAHDPTCATWAAARTAPTLLVTTDPATGLIPFHTETLSAWARALRT